MDRPTILWRTGAAETVSVNPTPERVSIGVVDAACVCDEKYAGSVTYVVHKGAHGGLEDGNNVADDMALGMDNMLLQIDLDKDSFTPLTSIGAQQSMLKKLGNTQRYEMHPMCKIAMFVADCESLDNVVKDCNTELETMQKTYRLIYYSILLNKAKINEENVDEILRDIKFGIRRTTLSCRNNVDDMMSGYDHTFFD